MTTQKRAKVGGETGTNGEFYEGGKFLPSTARPKRDGSRPKKARKVEVEPFTWVTLEPSDDRKPIFSIVGVGAGYIDRYDWRKGIEPCLRTFVGGVNFYGDRLEDISVLCDRFNAGERWM